MNRTALTSLMIFALAACGNEPQGKTTTKLDAVDVQSGTISDSMTILDDSGDDGTAIDNAVPSDDSANPAANKNKERSAESASPDAETDDTVKPGSETKSSASTASTKKAADE